MAIAASPGKRPVWMARTLMAEGDGFFFSQDIDEATRREAAKSPNPYTRLALALLQLRRGDFAAGGGICDVLLSNDAEGVWIAGGHLLAHAIPHDSLRRIGGSLLDSHPGDSEDADFVRVFTCRIWARAMMLLAVPDMIQLYRQTKGIDARIRILVEIADLFESRPSSLYDAIDVGDETFDETAYLRMLEERYAQAVETAKAANTNLFYRGTPFAFPTWTRQLLARLARIDERENFGIDRLIFEAHSGERCSSWFTTHKEFLPLAAAAAIEEFLESGKAESYEPGGRYFFGNRVPD